MTVQSVKTGPQALPRVRRPTTPRRIYALLTVIAVLSAAIIAASLVRQRDEALAAGGKLAEAFARLADEQTARTFQTVEQTLQLADNLVASMAAVGTANETSVREQFRRMLQNRPFLRALRVLDDAGRVVFDSDTGMIGADLSARPFFPYHRDTPASRFDVDIPVQHPQTGEWTMPASWARRGADGGFVGVIVAALDPAFFDRVWTAGRSPDAVVGLFREDGRMLVRSPLDYSLMGKSYDHTQTFGRLRAAGDEGIFEVTTPNDGVRRIAAFRRLGAYPGFIMGIGQDKAAVLANWWHTVWITSTGWAAVVAAVAVLTTLLLRELKVRRAADERSRLLFDASPYPIYAIDLENERVIAGNDEAVAKYGWPRSEFIGMPVDNLYPPDELPHLRAVREKVLPALPPLGSGEAMQVVEGLRHRTRSGEIIDVEMNVRRIELDGRQATLVMARDVTDRVRAEKARQAVEEQLRQSQKMEAIGQLTGGVAHDFNNILTIIMANVEALQEREGLDPRAAARFDDIVQAVFRAADLTSRLLAFSRKQPLRPQPTDIGVLMATTAAMQRRSLGAQIEIELKLSADLWSVNVDRNQLTTALVNLCVNARDAMPAGGRLTIETANVTLDTAAAARLVDAAPGDYAMLAVGDNGTGMTADVAAKAFDPFFTTKEIGKGTGLGLSMVYGFIKQSSGHIVIDSAPGRGTTFRLYLPRGTARQTNKAIAHDADIVGGTERILVVEDQAQVRASVVLQLKGLGYVVAEAADGAAGVAACEAAAPERARPFDLLLTDVVMPGALTGRDLADEALRRWPSVKVVFMSGYSDNVLTEDGELAADVLLLGKPFRKAELASIVRQALDTSARATSLVT